MKKSRPRYVPSVVPSVSAIRSPIAKRTPGVTSSSWADLAPVGKGATSAHDQVLQGRALRKANLYQGALEHYLKAIELESDNTETWNETGITYNKLKQYDKAEAAFRRSIQCAHDSPDGAYPCYNLAGLLDDGPRRNEAIPLYLEAIRLKPKEPIYYNNLGWLYEKLGRQQEALSLYDQALIADPYYARARKNAVDLRAKLHAAPKTP